MIHMEYRHVPVMLNEVVKYLNLKEGSRVVDCTLGGAGYTLAISERIGQTGVVLGIDLDPIAIKNAKERIKKEKKTNIIIINENFKNLHKIVSGYFENQGDSSVHAIVFDLGLSSAQLEDRNRGFSFQLDAPLDMTFGQSSEIKAKQSKTEFIINKYKEAELEKIFKEYGEERYAKVIARKIVEERKEKWIKTTKELLSVIKGAVPKIYRYGKKIHFATKTFQALRIATNDELGNLEKALSGALKSLHSGGRIVVISYHSLEDRIVKHFFRHESKDCVCPRERPLCNCGHLAELKIINKKILIPSREEVANNPRARSAKMRVAEKI